MGGRSLTKSALLGLKIVSINLETKSRLIAPVKARQFLFSQVNPGTYRLIARSAVGLRKLGVSLKSKARKVTVPGPGSTNLRLLVKLLPR